MMNRQPESIAPHVLTSNFRRGLLALLLLLAGVTAAAEGQSQADTSGMTSPIHATHILGFEEVRRNIKGELLLDDQNLRFQPNGSPAAQVAIRSIQNISVDEQDKQVGGVPMMLGKAAVPFGGGRMVSLLSHKKYDSLAIAYLDHSGGFHGAIFRLAKGEGERLKKVLVADGAGIAPAEYSASEQRTSEDSPEIQKWSVQVEKVDPAATSLDPCFSDAIYENHLRELIKSKRFKHVFRSGDRSANDIPDVLVLKTIVEKYSPGSETRRAVTTVAGATKLKVHIQLVTRDGRIMLERTIDGNVRFIGDNLAATNTVARRTSKLLKRSSLPGPSAQPATPTQAGTIL